MSADRSYVVGVGLELADDAIEAVSREIETALKDVPPLQLKVSGIDDLNRLVTLLENVSKNADAVSTAVSRVTSEEQRSAQTLREIAQYKSQLQTSEASYARDRFNDQVKLNNALKQSLDLFSKITDAERNTGNILSQGVREGRRYAPDNNDLFNGASTDDLIARNRSRNASFGAIADVVTATYSMNQEAINNVGSDALEEQRTAADSARESMTRLGSQYAVASDALSKFDGMVGRNLSQLDASVARQERINNQLPDMIRNYHGLADTLAHTATQFAEWSFMAKGIESVAGGISKAFQDTLKSQQEQTIQGFYYQAAGKQFTPTLSNDTMDAAIGLARLYGEDVMHVQEAIGLWAKTTHGELLPALALTEQAMKLNAVSGMNMEQIYRSTIAIMSQTQQPLSKVPELYNVALEAALKYGGGVRSLEGAGEDMVQQMMSGMDLTAAVFSKAGLSAEQMAAAVSITVNDLRVSGQDAGRQLSAVFAKLEEGKPREMLHQMGIETQNNSHFVEDLANNYGKLGAVFSMAVRPQNAEVFQNLMKNVHQYMQAVKELQDAAKGNLSDDLMQKLMGTAQFQLGQIKTSIEALGITVGRDLLPEINSAVGVFNNQLYPTLLRNHEAVADLIRTLVSIGGTAVAFSILRTGLATAGRAAFDFRDAMNSVGFGMTETSRFETVAETSLTAYQRALLKTLSVNGEVSAEMEADIKTLAATTGASIDVIIRKWLEAAGVVQEATGKMALSESAEATAVENLARTTSLSAAQIETSMAAAAESSVASVGTIASAVWKAIPMIGMVAMAGQIGFGIAREVQDKADAGEIAHMRSDPKYRARVVERARVDQLNALAHEHMNERNQHYTVGPGGMLIAQDGGVDQTNWRGVYSQSQHTLDLAAEASKDPAAQFSSRLAASTKQLWDQQKKDWASQLGILNKTFASQPGQQLQDQLNGANGATSATQQQSLANLQLIDTNKTLIDQQEQKIAADDAAIAKARQTIAIHDATRQSIEALGAAYDKKAADLQSLEEAQRKAAGDYKTAHDNLLQQAQQAGGSKTKEGIAFLKQAEEMQQKADAAALAVSRLDAQIQILQSRKDAETANDLMKTALNDPHIKMLQTFVNQDNVSLKGQGKRQTSEILGLTASDSNALADALEKIAKGYEHGGTAYQAFAQHLEAEVQRLRENAAAHKAHADEIKQTAEDLDQTLSSRLQDLSVELAYPYDQHLQSAMKQALDLQRQYNSEMEKLAAAGDTAGMALEKMWAKAQAQLIENNLQLSYYNDRVKDFKDSAIYGVASTGIDTIGKTLSSNILGRMDGSTSANNQVNSLQLQISQLEQQKALLNGKWYEAQRGVIDQEVKALQERIKQIKDAEAHPTLGKQIAKDIEKSLVDGFVKKWEESIKQNLINQFVPKQKEAVDKEQEVVNTFKDVVNGQLKTSFDNWGTSADGLTQALNRFSDTVGVPGAPGSLPSATSAVGMSSVIAATGSTLGGINILGGGGGSAAGAGTAASAAGMAGLWAKYGGRVKSGFNALGDFGMADNGMQTGGLMGGLETGIGVDAGIWSMIGAFPGLAALGPYALPIAAAAALYSGFSHHDNPALMPDKYNTSSWGQTNANLWGAGVGTNTGNPMIANGQSFNMDSGLAKDLGNKGELQYINDYIASNPSLASQVLSPDLLKEFSGLNDTKPIIDGKNGNLELSNGTWVPWQQLADQANSAVQAIQNFKNAANAATQPLIAIQGFGGSGLTPAFSPYYTPGFGNSYDAYMQNTPYYATTASPTNVNGSAPSQGGGAPGGGNPHNGNGPVVNITKVYLNQRQIAQAVNDIRYQQNQMGQYTP